MAASEARAAWQRTANRYFVQEDAKRAPKLACPSSPYLSSKQTNPDPADIPNGFENPNIGFTPPNRNSNLSPESRWWLQIQPNYVYQKGLTHEEVTSADPQMENCKAEVVNENQVLPVIGDGMGESYELLEMDSTGSSTASKKVDELGFGSDSLWPGSGRSEPWWRVADGDELASLVSQRSLELFDNCDLPWPQNRSVRSQPHGSISAEIEARKSGISSPKVVMGCRSTLDNARRTTASCEEQGVFGSDKNISEHTIRKGLTEPLANDPTKAELMEALRHSQTRAREAEKAAKQANAEREHIIKLFFKQASHLFAYKQWFQLLQLEDICLHIKNSNQPLSSLFSVDFPFTTGKHRKLPKIRKNLAKRKKRGKSAHPEKGFGKFYVAFALGLGFVGAGLFLGWTFAWMLPAF